MPILAIAAGHHNTQGGNPVEHRIVGELAEAYRRAFIALDFTVHALTPDGLDADDEPGDGEFPGTIAAVARKAIEVGADLLIELHTEAGPSGVFVIYPDWGDDVDTDVRDRLGPRLAEAIARAAGLPVRGTGIMSERLTDVGVQGFRLALFAATAGARADMTRLLVEHGAHTQPADLARLEQPAVREAMALAAARVCAEFYGLTAPAPAPRPETGIERAMRLNGDSAVGPEQYIHERISGHDIMSVQPGRLGIYWYHPAAGKVAFQAWEG